MLSLASRIMVVGTYEWRHYSCSVCALARDARTLGESGQDSCDRRRRPKTSIPLVGEGTAAECGRRRKAGQFVWPLLKNLPREEDSFPFPSLFFSWPPFVLVPLQEGRRRKREKERQKQHLSLRAIRNFSPAAQAATTVERRRRRAEPHARCTVEASLFAPPKHEEEEGEIEEGSRAVYVVYRAKKIPPPPRCRDLRCGFLAFPA